MPINAVARILMHSTSHTPPATAVSDMRTLPGLLTSYWKGDMWGSAWFHTAMVGALTIAIAYNGLEMVKDWAAFSAILPGLMDPAKNITWESTRLLLEDAAWQSVIVGGLTALRHGFSTNHHRLWRGWLDGKFTQAMLDSKVSLMHIMHLANQLKSSGDGPDISKKRGWLRQKFSNSVDHVKDKIISYMPFIVPPKDTLEKKVDNIDQRKTECIKDVTGAALGLVQGGVSAASWAIFSTFSLWQMSKQVNGYGMEYFGGAGTFMLAFASAALCVPIGTVVHNNIGKLITFINTRMQVTEANYRSHTNNMLRKAESIASGNTRDMYKSENNRIYKDVNRTWIFYNAVHVGAMLVKDVYNTASRCTIALAALPNGMQHSFTHAEYLAATGVVGALINNLEWFIDITSAWANLKANVGRLTGLADAIETVHDADVHFNQKGISKFVYTSQEKALGLTVRNLEIMPEGLDAAPFLTARNFRIKPGDRACIIGPNGSGKSCTLKALAGGRLQVYGRGSIACNDDHQIFYAEQNIELEKVSLKQLVTYSALAENFNDREVAFALKAVGLGDFEDYLGHVEHEEKEWNRYFSGGQKQMLVVARIILQNPGIILMDEPTSALDIEARGRFYHLLDTHCRNAAIISTVHNVDIPVFFNSVLHIENRMMTQKSVGAYKHDILNATDDADRMNVMPQVYGPQMMLQ